MKRRSLTLSVWLVLWLLAAALLAVPGAWAKPTTPEQAQTVVLNWLGLDALPLGARLGRQIKEVQTFNHGDTPAYYVVYLNPAGLVFLPADDLVEPIIGFLPAGQFDPSPANPLGALVSQDIPGRVLQARAVEAKGPEALAPETSQAKAQRKWDLLTKPTGPKASEFGTGSISDVRVASFVQSRWNQAGADGSLPDPYCNNPCYNYFTPPGLPGSRLNYVCGCVATAMSQLMRYWTYPTNGIGVHYYTYYIDGAPDNTHPTRGGDDSGGPYVWSNMPTTTSVSTPYTQCRAIGQLTWDAGISVGMDYNSIANGGSGADTLAEADAFVNTFQYSNAKKGYNAGNNLPDTNRNAMVNPNLHAQYPVLFGITGNGGHAIVCDGYGYNSSTMYHHLNLGWSGSDDAWYNLPTIDTSSGTWTSVYKCIYNVYPSGSGEIIAGRVTDAGGSPLSGVAVSATGGYSTTTDANGIYALAKVPSSTTFTVSASKTGYTSSSQAVTTGASANMSTTTGNQWPIDFTIAVPVITLNQALDNTRLSFSTSGNANWYGESATWYYGGSAAQSGAITASQSTSLQTTVVGPGTLTFYWKVSSEPNHDYLNLFLDATLIDGASGSVDWARKTVNVPAGIHTVIWQYAKDSSGSQGSDCGWVDKVVYIRKGRVAPLLPLLLN